MRTPFVLLSLLVSGCVSSGGGEVDLLELVDPGRDGVKGTWRFEGGRLETPRETFGRLQIPYALPGEYDLVAEVERMEGNNSFVFGLRVGGKTFAIMLDSDPESTSGIDQVDKAPFYDNDTTHRGKLFETGKSAKIRISVRKDRVRVSVDGQWIIDWPVDAAKLDLYPEWKVGDERALFVGSWETVYRIKSLVMAPFSGKGEILSK